MDNHHFEWVNQLFLWPFPIATLNYQRDPEGTYHESTGLIVCVTLGSFGIDSQGHRIGHNRLQSYSSIATCWVSRGGLPGLGMSLPRVSYVKIMYVHPQPFRRRNFSWYLQCFFIVFTVACSRCLYDKG